MKVPIYVMCIVDYVYVGGVRECDESVIINKVKNVAVVTYYLTLFPP